VSVRPPPDIPRDRYYVRSVERALSILRLFISGAAQVSVAHISREIHLPQSTTFRLLATLCGAGLLEHDPRTGKYSLGVACLELGNAFLRDQDLRQRALPHLQTLRDETGETVHLALFDGRDVVYLEKLAGLHAIGLMSSRVGGRSPAHCTGVGKALLAYLPPEDIDRLLADHPLESYTPRTITDPQALQSELARVREKGYALDTEEHEPGVMCVAAPILDHNGVAAAISVSGPVGRIQTGISSEDLLAKVLQTASAISVQLGGARPSTSSR